MENDELSMFDIGQCFIPFEFVSDDVVPHTEQLMLFVRR
jgi:hypothetical protein